MMDREAARILAQLAPDALLTIQVRAADWAAAIEELEGGPEDLSTRDCSRLIGRSSGWWGERAHHIPGAVKDANGRWRIPNRAARDYYAGLRRNATKEKGEKRHARKPWKSKKPATAQADGARPQPRREVGRLHG